MTSAAQSAGRSAKNHARSAADSKPVKIGARVGIAAYGVTHLIIAWLALQLAFGNSAQTDQQGAFATLAQQPFGAVLLWIMVIGFAAVALWRLQLAFFGYAYESDDRTKQIRHRVTAGVKAVVFAVLAVASARTAMGSGGGGGGGQQAAGGVLGMPGGQFLVGAAGLVVLGVGIKKVVDGVRKKFLEDMSLPSEKHTRTAATRSGQIGFIAKGASLGLIGVLVVVAAVRFDPAQANGLDAALKTLAGQPYGMFLLILMAAGLAAYAVFCAFDARYHKV